MSCREPKGGDGCVVAVGSDLSRKRPAESPLLASGLAKIPKGSSRQKTPNERASATEDEATMVQDLNEKIKNLQKYYKIKGKIGEGAFSTVLKAVDVRHDHYINDSWQSQLVSGRQASNPKRNDPRAHVLCDFVVLKRLHSTSSPKRIANEITVLNDLRGCPCVTPLITAFRLSDEVILVMPYIEHDDFKDMIVDMEMEDVKCYMRSLLVGLSHLHKCKYIHRDVKPHNFLYSKRLKTGVLIDFGLAQKIESTSSSPDSDKENSHPSTAQSPSQPPSHPTRRPLSPLTTNNRLSQQETPKTNKHSFEAPTKYTPSNSQTTTNSSQDKEHHGLVPKHAQISKLPGYLKNDKRGVLQANRAGTKGFRAPEVLLRDTHQTEAIDIWSAGTILISILSGRFPFFLAKDDADGLVEIATIFGLEAVKTLANKIGRTFVTNIPTIPKQSRPLLDICKALNPKQFQTWDEHDISLAMDLLQACLTVDSAHRITAEQALAHPFLAA